MAREGERTLLRDVRRPGNGRCLILRQLLRLRFADGSVHVCVQQSGRLEVHRLHAGRRTRCALPGHGRALVEDRHLPCARLQQAACACPGDVRREGRPLHEHGAERPSVLRPFALEGSVRKPRPGLDAPLVRKARHCVVQPRRGCARVQRAHPGFVDTRDGRSRRMAPGRPRQGVRRAVGAGELRRRQVPPRRTRRGRGVSLHPGVLAGRRTLAHDARPPRREGEPPA